MALKDILLAGSKYADDMVISLPDGTTATIGEMRALEVEEKQRLLQRSQTLEQAETELAKRIHAAAQQGLLEPSQPRHTDADLRSAAATQYGLTEDDPLLGQVVKEMKRMEADNAKKLEAIQTANAAELRSLKEITAKAVGGYLSDRYATKFSAAQSALPADIAKKVTLEDAIKYAETNRLMDSVGAYDINAAVERLTWNDMKEHERAEIRKQATMDAEKAAALSRIKPSGIRTVNPEASKGFDPFVKDGDRTRTKSLDEVLAEAANDEALWASAAMGLPN